MLATAEEKRQRDNDETVEEALLQATEIRTNNIEDDIQRVAS